MIQIAGNHRICPLGMYLSFDLDNETHSTDPVPRRTHQCQWSCHTRPSPFRIRAARLKNNPRRECQGNPVSLKGMMIIIHSTHEDPEFVVALATLPNRGILGIAQARMNRLRRNRKMHKVCTGTVVEGLVSSHSSSFY